MSCIMKVKICHVIFPLDKITTSTQLKNLLFLRRLEALPKWNAAKSSNPSIRSIEVNPSLWFVKKLEELSIRSAHHIESCQAWERIKCWKEERVRTGGTENENWWTYQRKCTKYLALASFLFIDKSSQLQTVSKSSSFVHKPVFKYSCMCANSFFKNRL